MSAAASDNLRWLGTTVLAGSICLMALFGVILLALNRIQSPDVLNTIAGGGAVGFFTAFGSMVGARASQNATQIAANQPVTGNGLH